MLTPWVHVIDTYREACWCQYLLGSKYWTYCLSAVEDKSCTLCLPSFTRQARENSFSLALITGSCQTPVTSRAMPSTCLIQESCWLLHPRSRNWQTVQTTHYLQLTKSFALHPHREECCSNYIRHRAWDFTLSSFNCLKSGD